MLFLFLLAGPLDIVYNILVFVVYIILGILYFAIGSVLLYGAGAVILAPGIIGLIKNIKERNRVGFSILALLISIILTGIYYLNMNVFYL